MTYYFISAKTGEILESAEDGDIDKMAQEIANEENCEVWVIQGQHSGITCEPSYHKNESELLRRWNNGEGLPA